MADREPLPRMPLKLVRGCPMMNYIAENYAQVEKFQARPDDLLISTYPKSGTTLLSEVVEMLYFDGDTEKCGRDTIANRVPFIDFAIPGLMTGAELAAQTPSPRILKSHLPVRLLPESFWENNCKIICTFRNPKDVAVSFYNFHLISRVHPEPGTWLEFLENFMDGNVSYGSWFHHVKDWWEIAQTYPNLLFLFYEDMLEDPRREICKVAKFLGKDISTEVLEKTVHHTSFQQMKVNSKVNYDGEHPMRMDTRIGPFMRKGIVGDWKNNFTVAQNEKFDVEFERQMSGTTLRLRTSI